MRVCARLPVTVSWHVIPINREHDLLDKHQLQAVLTNQNLLCAYERQMLKKHRLIHEEFDMKPM